MKSQFDRLFLHIGLRKTGSTYIQRFCELNRELLSRRGFLYPEHDPADARFGKSAGHWGLYKVIERRDYALLGKNYWPVHAIQKNLILSNEALTSEHTDTFNIAFAAREFFPKETRVTIILYLRRQDQLVNSVYNEGIISGNRKASWTESEFLSEDHVPEQDFERLIKTWAEAFGRENLLIRVLEESQLKSNDLIVDFLDCLGLEYSGDFVLPEHAFRNVSPDTRLIESLRLINSVPLKQRPHYRIFVDRVFEELVYSNQWSAAQTESSLSQGALKRLLQKHSIGNKRIASDFLRRKSGKLFDDEGPIKSGRRLETEVSLALHILSIFLDIKSRELEEFSLELKKQIVDDFMSKQSETDSSVLRLAQEANQMQRSITACIEKITEFKGPISEAPDEITELKTVTKNLETQNSEQARDISSLQDSTTKHKSQLDELRQIMEQFETLVGEQNRDMRLLQRSLAQNVCQIDTIEFALKRQEDIRQNQDAALSGLKTLHHQLSSQFATLRDEIDQLNSDIPSFVVDFESAGFASFLKKRSSPTQKILRAFTFATYREIRRLKNNRIVDPEYYFSKYPETMFCSQSAVCHFVKHGIYMGYNPAPNINIKRHVAINGRLPLNGEF